MCLSERACTSESEWIDGNSYLPIECTRETSLRQCIAHRLKHMGMRYRCFVVACLLRMLRLLSIVKRARCVVVASLLCWYVGCCVGEWRDVLSVCMSCLWFSSFMDVWVCICVYRWVVVRLSQICYWALCVHVWLCLSRWSFNCVYFWMMCLAILVVR